MNYGGSATAEPLLFLQTGTVPGVVQRCDWESAEFIGERAAAEGELRRLSAPASEVLP